MGTMNLKTIGAIGDNNGLFTIEVKSEFIPAPDCT